MLEKRVRNKNLLKKVVSPEVAASVVKDGMVIGTGGGIWTGYPKTFFNALVERGKRGELKEISLWSGAQLGKEIDGGLAREGLIKRRLGSHADSALRKSINSGKVLCNDMRTEIMPLFIRSNILGKVDVAVIDAVAVTEEGHIIPNNSPIDITACVEKADILIVEINYAQPAELEGMHDIYSLKVPPHQREIPLYKIGDRVGKPYIVAGEDKITYIIESHEPEKYPDLQPGDEKSKRIGEFLVDFFADEVKKGKLPPNLFPLEVGIGNIPDAVVKCLAQSDFKDLEFFTPVVGDGIFELIESGKCKVATTVAFWLCKDYWERFCTNVDKYRDKIILRTTDIIHNPEILKRLGVIALHGAIEIDIYGHVNITHIGGTQLVSGVGGSMVFAQNAFLSVFAALSSGKGGDISTIVPMVAHVDHTEHAVDVIVTEHGLADLRGLAPVERAQKIINNCAHPDYRPLLRSYLEKAQQVAGGHEPHLLEEAFSFQLRLKETGSMKVK